MSIFNRLFRGGLPPDRTDTILGRYLDKNFRVSPMAESRPSLEDLNALGARLGVRFPVEFAAHVCGTFPGVYIEVKEEIWPRPKPYDVGPAWSFLYAIHTYTVVSTSPGWMRLEATAGEFQERTGFAAAPILSVVADANVYCVDAKADILQYNHEANVLQPVRLGFWELFEREVGALRDRKDKRVALEHP